MVKIIHRRCTKARRYPSGAGSRAFGLAVRRTDWLAGWRGFCKGSYGVEYDVVTVIWRLVSLVGTLYFSNLYIVHVDYLYLDCVTRRQNSTGVRYKGGRAVNGAGNPITVRQVAR